MGEKRVDLLIKAIIFDRAGVLTIPTNYDYLEYLSKVSKIDIKEIKRIYVPIVRELNIGKMGTLEFKNALAKRLKIPKKLVRYHEFSEENFSLDPKIIRYVYSLRKDYKVICLTDISISRYLIFKKNLPKNLFHRIFATCYMHLRKSDKRIYLSTLRKLKLKPSETIFIDDLTEYINAARSLGIKSIQFKNISQLKKEIGRLGVTQGR